jgi:hypothetical protein
MQSRVASLFRGGEASAMSSSPTNLPIPVYKVAGSTLSTFTTPLARCISLTLRTLLQDAWTCYGLAHCIGGDLVSALAADDIAYVIDMISFAV